MEEDADDVYGVQEEDERQPDESVYSFEPQVIIYTPAKPFKPALRRSSISGYGSERGLRIPWLVHNSFSQVRDRKGRFSSARKAVTKAPNLENKERRGSSLMALDRIAFQAELEDQASTFLFNGDIKKRRRSSSVALDRIAFQAELEDQASTIFDEYVDDAPPSTLSRLPKSSVPLVNRALFRAGKAASDDGSLWELPVPKRSRALSESGAPRTPHRSPTGRFMRQTPDAIADLEPESPMQLRSAAKPVLPALDDREPPSENEEFFDTQKNPEQEKTNVGTTSEAPSSAVAVMVEIPTLPTSATNAAVQSTNNLDLDALHRSPPGPNAQVNAPNISRRRISSLFSPPAKRMKRNKAEDFFDKVEKPLNVEEAVAVPSQGQLDEDIASKAFPEIPNILAPLRNVVQLLLEEASKEINNQKVAKEKAKRPPTKSPFFIPSATSPTKKGKSKSSNDVEGDSSVLPSTPRKSTTFSPSKRSPGCVVPCIPFPPLSSPTFGLIQEKLAHDPFRLLIAVTFLNRTRGKQAIPVFFSLIEKYPTPTALANASTEEIVDIIRHLGLQNQRAATYQQYARQWIDDPPTKGKRYAVKGYPEYKSGRDIKKGEIIDDQDERDAWEIGHMTQGPYAIDSWRIFCRDELRGLASNWNGGNAVSGNHMDDDVNLDKPFQPEWMRVLPEDKELRAYLRWMWLKEGFEWDPFTGDKDVASEELQRAAVEGMIAWDELGGMRVLDGDVVDEIGAREKPRERVGKVACIVENSQEGDIEAAGL
jgi:methyl-CpG-binding domain protein 4